MFLAELIKPHIGHHLNQNILLQEYRAIYLFIPKVACSSIKKVIADTLGIPPYDPSQPDKYIHRRIYPYAKRARIYGAYKDYFKFSFVRNPFDRLVSCYSNKLAQDKYLNNEYFTNGVARIFKKYKGLFWGGMSFEDFAASVAQIPDNRADPHIRSQWLTMVDQRDHHLADYVGKFENLQEDFTFVCKTIGFPVKELPRLLKSDHKDYREYYTNKTIEIVQQRYSKDLETFQYDFER
jgi:chondroitin 4-sulfotransferase 11